MENRKEIGLIVAACALIAAGAYFYYRMSGPAATPVLAPESGKPAAPQAPAALPMTLEQGEATIHEEAAGLSPDPLMGRWLKVKDLIRRITAAADAVAGGGSPRLPLDFLAPAGKFSVKRKGGALYLDPKSYARYDRAADAFASLSASAVAGLYARLKPLFEEACKEEGCWKLGFQGTLTQAIQQLLQAPQVQGDIRLRKKVISYAMTDGFLEGLGAAPKHLLRMGPRNTAIIQGKLREIALALGIPDDKLPHSAVYSAK